MTKLSITYRATIDRHVPVAVRTRKDTRSRAGRTLSLLRERIRI